MAERAKLVRKTEIPVQVGHQSPTDAKSWVRQQIPYKNFAGVNESLDMKASEFVAARRLDFRNRMSGPMERWSMNWDATNANVFWRRHDDDVHVPETQKMLMGKVSRIEEAITQFDPVFEAEGTRGDLSRRKAAVIGSYVYRQMELAGWQDLVQPVAKDGELCNTMAIKVAWEELVSPIIERKIELRHRDNGESYYHDERWMRDAVARAGVRYHQVDPFWFIYDIDAANPQECAYIGDEDIPFLHELEQMAELGYFPKKQIEKVRERAVKGWTTAPGMSDISDAEWVDHYRRSRSIALQPDMAMEQKGRHGARRVRRVELWAWFDFGKDGFEGVTDPLGRLVRGTQRVVITIANGVVIRFQLNPFDKKFVPYAVARVNRNGHEMPAVANFDSVTQANKHYDRFASNFMRWLDLAVSPIVVTSDLNSDLEETIQNVIPGTVLRAAGDWDYIKAPDINNAVGYADSWFRRWMEESSGSLRIHEQAVNTATETERKVQEQQRMVRASIRANAELWRQVALLTHWISAQFASKPEQFAVVGKASSILGRYATITPDVLQEDVDFRFLGITSLHTFGNRAQGMSQWMMRWGQLLGTMPEVNLNNLARLDFELSVGRANLGEIFPANDPAWESWTQEEENEMMLAGQPVSVHPADDDLEHIKKTVAVLRQKKLPPYVAELFVDHLREHIEQGRKKAQEAQAREDKAKEQAKLMSPTGGMPGTDRPPSEGGMPAHEKPGVAPGPTAERTTSRPSRSGSRSQEQEMATR